MQFISTVLLAALSTMAVALPATAGEASISIPSNLDNTAEASFHLKCSGQTFVSCAEAAGSTAKDCVEAIAKKGKSASKDLECAKDIYEDFKQHQFAACKSCF